MKEREIIGDDITSFTNQCHRRCRNHILQTATVFRCLLSKGHLILENQAYWSRKCSPRFHNLHFGCRHYCLRSKSRTVHRTATSHPHRYLKRNMKKKTEAVIVCLPYRDTELCEKLKVVRKKRRGAYMLLYILQIAIVCCPFRANSWLVVLLQERWKLKELL